MNRAFSVLTVTKAAGGARRQFSGMATTPSPDRMDDTIDPMGVKYRNPLALLWQHRHDMPIGVARFAPPTPRGIAFEAEVATLDEPGALKDRLDEAWQSIKVGFVRAVSIGFRPLKAAPNAGGGVDYLEIECFELSAVTIPANAEALITEVKSLDRIPPDLVAMLARADRSGSVKLYRPGVPLATGRPRSFVA